MYVVGIQGVEIKAEKQYLQVPAVNFARLMEAVQPQVQKSQKTPHRVNTKRKLLTP